MSRACLTFEQLLDTHLNALIAATEPLDAHLALVHLKPITRIAAARLPAHMDAVRRAAWLKLHSVPWQQTELIHRRVFAFAALALALLRRQFHFLDLALLLGAGKERDMAMSVIETVQAAMLRDQAAARKQWQLPAASSQRRVRVKRRKVARTSIDNVPKLNELPSLSEFEARFMRQSAPVVLRGGMQHWPAIDKWSVEYIQQVAGWRTVAVEVGRHYLHREWKQRLMTIDEFVAEYMSESSSSSSSECGYIAQTRLFEQVTVLRRDFAVPDYCAMSGIHIADFDEPEFARQQRERDTQVGEVAVHAWFGPQGTFSPLHHDPSNNWLCQVFGRKRVRLYAPQHTRNLYPFAESDRMRWNSSQIDLSGGADNVDHKQFPLFRDTPFLECTLEAGEMLYIPPRWWHCVESLSESFSISFWWY